jgi:polyhydroxyalkanoate synthesis regulator phasin
MADRYALASFQKLVTFLNTMSNANNALTKFILVDKKLPLETEESRFQFIIPHEEGGHNIEDIIKVYTSLNKIYRDLTKLDGKESDLKIVYVESGSEILTELKGIIEIISMMYFLYKLFENKDRERTHNQIADIKEAYEFKDWVEERVKKGKISPEDAKYLIDDIAYNVKQLRGIDLDFDKSEIILPQQLPQTTESKNDDDISKIKE